MGPGARWTTVLAFGVLAAPAFAIETPADRGAMPAFVPPAAAQGAQPAPAASAPAPAAAAQAPAATSPPAPPATSGPPGDVPPGTMPSAESTPKAASPKPAGAKPVREALPWQAPAKGPAAPGAPGCTRLPLSDIQFTREKTIEVARMRLDEYAQKVSTQRGWKGFKKSDETIACDVYLNLGPLGTEYKCLVTATFCPQSGGAATATAKPGSAAPAAGAAPAAAAKPAAIPATPSAPAAKPAAAAGPVPSKAP